MQKTLDLVLLCFYPCLEGKSLSAFNFCVKGDT